MNANEINPLYSINPYRPHDDGKKKGAKKEKKDEGEENEESDKKDLDKNETKTEKSERVERDAFVHEQTDKLTQPGYTMDWVTINNLKKGEHLVSSHETEENQETKHKETNDDDWGFKEP